MKFLRRLTPRFSTRSTFLFMLLVGAYFVTWELTKRRYVTQGATSPSPFVLQTELPDPYTMGYGHRRTRLWVGGLWIELSTQMIFMDEEPVVYFPLAHRNLHDTFHGSETVFLRHTNAEEVAATVKDFFTRLPPYASQSIPISIKVDANANSVSLTAEPHEMKEARELIHYLEEGGAGQSKPLVSCGLDRTLWRPDLARLPSAETSPSVPNSAERLQPSRSLIERVP